MVAAAILAFYVQVYLDFSAYTDMGRGCAHDRLSLTNQLRNPYFANSFRVFRAMARFAFFMDQRLCPYAIIARSDA